MVTLFGIAGAVLICGAGYLSLRLLRLDLGWLVFGVAPTAGVALLATLATWAWQFGLAEHLAGIGLFTLSVAGLWLAARDLVRHGGARWSGLRRSTVGLLLSAVGISVIVLAAGAFVQAGVPDYVHDGATHTEIVDAMRQGVRLEGYGWYPPGFHATVAALLALLPWVDSAAGTVGWSLTFTILAPLVVFGLTVATFDDIRAGAFAALLIALTSTYPYGVHLYSVWPMAASLIVVIGLWTIGVHYIRHPRPGPGVLAGVFAGATLLTHGTDLITAALGLVAIALASWRCLEPTRLMRHTALALVCAVLVSLPYVPSLHAWVTAGGAVAVGADYFDFRRSFERAPLDEALFWASAVSSGYLVDLPARALLLGLGAWASARTSGGRVLTPLLGVFALIVVLARHVDASLVRTLFALTLPWAVDDRLVMVVSIIAAPLGAIGLVRLVHLIATRPCVRLPGGLSISTRRIARLGTVLGLAGAAASIVLVGQKFNIQTSGLVTYSASDAQAMAWLHEHMRPGEILLNDGTADAGIWAAYKAGVPILLPRTRVVDPDGPELVLRRSLAEIDRRPDLRRAVCALHVAYVFRGAASSPAQIRQFPSVATLLGLVSLEEIFRSGDATVFRMRSGCG